MWVVGGYILGYSGLQWVTHEGRKKRTTMDYFKRKLDDKNRLTIPAYLHLYTQEVWEGEMRQALSGSWKTEGDRPAILDQELADLTDRFLDGQQVTVLDQKQGRITIEPDLLERAGFDRIKDVVATRIYTPTGSYWRLKTPRT
jgi:hypothetical protein